MRIVLDTNVLVAGLLSPFGTCGEVVRMLTSGEVVLCVDARILLEYEAVLRRPRFGFSPEQCEKVLAYLRHAAEVHSSVPLEEALPDADDQPFLEVAKFAAADGLVTGNLRHFPASCRAGVRVWSPKEFLDAFRKRRGRTGDGEGPGRTAGQSRLAMP